MSGPVLLLSIIVPILPETLPPFPPSPKPLQVVRLTSKEASLYCAAFFPDGKTIVFGGGWCLDVKAGKILHTHLEHKFAIKSVAVSPDGKFVATGGGYGEVRVWNPAGKVLHSVCGYEEYTYSICFSPDGKWLAHTGGNLILRNTRTFEVVPKIENGIALPRAKPYPLEKGMMCVFGPYMAFSPDGRTIVGCYPWGELNFLSVPQGKEVTKYRTKVRSQDFFWPRFSPDGKTLAVHTSIDTWTEKKKGKGERFAFSTEVWSIAGTELKKKRFEIPGHHLGMAFTPDSKFLLVGDLEDERNRIRVWDVTAGREVMSWVASRNGIRDLVMSPDGNLLVSCDDEDLGKIWDLKKILGRK